MRVKVQRANPTMTRRLAVVSSTSDAGKERRNLMPCVLPASRRACSSCTIDRPPPIAKKPVASIATSTWIASQADCSGGGSGVTST